MASTAKQANPAITIHQKGFTLVELLVALTIFAVLAAAGWQVFDQLQKTRERVTVQAEKLSRLQYAYMQINRDIAQYINRVGFSKELEVQGSVSEFEGDTFSIGLDVFANQLSFTRKAAFDPRYIGVDNAAVKQAFERVTFKLEDKKLMRYSSKAIDDSSAKALPAVLLENVQNLKIAALDPAPVYAWPPDDQGGLAAVSSDTEPTDEEIMQEATQLPLGVSISFDYMDMPITWRFALVKVLPSVALPKIEESNNTEDEQSEESSGDSASEGSDSSTSSSSNT